jgi:hypothetical protein
VLEVGGVAVWGGKEQLAGHAQGFAAGDRDEVLLVGVVGCRLYWGGGEVDIGGD